ncbi:MAG: CRISPR-associated endoribonuclease Cas6 [Thermoprotei archaeon]
MYMTRITLEFIPESTITVDSFTSIISKLILKNIQNHETIVSNIIASNALSNLTVSPVMSNNKPIYKFRNAGKKSSPVLLYAGKKYVFYVSFLSKNPVNELQDFFMKNISSGWRVSLYNTSILLVASQVKSININELLINLTGDFRIDFMTPTQFIIKIPMPTTKSWLRLFPLPHTLISNIALHWNKHVPNDMKIDIKNINKISYSYIHEAGYYLNPVTIIVRNNDHKHVIRGFIGWCVYKVDEKLNLETRNIIARLLAYAEFIGVGKGREIGLGMIKVRPGRIMHEKQRENEEEIIKSIG